METQRRDIDPKARARIEQALRDKVPHAVIRGRFRLGEEVLQRIKAGGQAYVEGRNTARPAIGDVVRRGTVLEYLPRAEALPGQPRPPARARVACPRCGRESDVLVTDFDRSEQCRGCGARARRIPEVPRSLNQAEVLILATEHASITVTLAIEEIGVEYHTAWNTIADLRKAKLLERQHRGRYAITELGLTRLGAVVDGSAPDRWRLKDQIAAALAERARGPRPCGTGEGSGTAPIPRSPLQARMLLAALRPGGVTPRVFAQDDGAKLVTVHRAAQTLERAGALRRDRDVLAVTELGIERLRVLCASESDAWGLRGEIAAALDAHDAAREAAA